VAISHPHPVPTALIAGLLVTVAAAGYVVAGRALAAAEHFRSSEATIYALGSKRAVGYFERVDGRCRVTLMIAERLGHGRLKVVLVPGESAALDSEEMVLTCASDARTVEVRRSAPTGS